MYHNYRYRATFDEIDLPLDWPLEVNYYEVLAYCQWQSAETRLMTVMTEAEWNQSLKISE
jgi:formylglycine-generating enzyme required for sulfatase activity